MEVLLYFITSRLPESMGGYALEIILGLCAAIIFGSLFEYLVHRFVMHDGLPVSEKKLLFPLQRENHAVLHHGTFYKQFDHEEDERGREISIVFTAKDILTFQLCFLPVMIAIAFVSPVVAICFSFVALVHNFLWNTIHRQMHQPGHPGWAKWGAYRFLARYHYLHHRHTGTNYNVVLPFMDPFFGTRAKATREDVEEIARLGYS
jgi:Fatty acid hydroxylase superfamily